MNYKIKITERGWAGHFICADRCRFRRNTLIEYKKSKIVVSTVGLMESRNGRSFEKIGCDRYYETMVFHSDEKDKRWNDPDVSREICIDEKCSIDKVDAEDVANEMHDNIVGKITERLINGEIFG